MGDDEKPEATPYVIWRWDCPECGDVNEGDDVEPSGEEQCSWCGALVVML